MREKRPSYLTELAAAQKRPRGKTIVMVGTALAQEGPIFPVMCSVHGPAHFRDLATASRAALLHAERFHKRTGYKIDYTPTAKEMIINEMNAEAMLRQRQKLEGL